MLFNKRVPRFLYETPEATPVGTPPVVEPVAASPWAADATTYFGEDAAAAANFDRYMREKQQPYVTQLEASTKDARELWDDLNRDPATTARDLIASVYANDPEIVNAYDAIFAAEPVATPPAAPGADEIPEWAKPLVEDHQTKRDLDAKAAQENSYKEFKDGLKTSHSLTDDDLALIDPFIFGSAHDADAAVAAYRAWLVKAGVAAAAPVAETPVAPPVVGDGVPAAVPPLATQYKTYDQIGDALRAHLSTQRPSATPPPVVG